MEASIPLTFMHVRILAASALISLCLGSVPAMAQDVETIESLSRSLSTLSCEGNEGRELGRCITDVLKRVKAIEYNFSIWYRTEVAAWRKAHDGDGISEEYTLALKEFNDMMQERRKGFQEQVREVRKAFFDQLNVVRVQKGEVNTRGSKPLTTDDVQELIKQCDEKFASDQDAERVCLRNLLQRKEAVEKRLQPVRARIQAAQERAELRKQLRLLR